MWFIGQSILAYIIKDSTKEKEIEKLLKKRMSLIKIEVNNLKDEEIVNYLLHPKMPDEIKKLIGEKITELEKSIFSTDEKRVESITKIFSSKKTFNAKQLKYDYYPKSFKKIIIDNL